jgi:hypothetical protein
MMYYIEFNRWRDAPRLHHMAQPPGAKGRGGA